MNYYMNTDKKLIKKNGQNFEEITIFDLKNKLYNSLKGLPLNQVIKEEVLNKFFFPDFDDEDIDEDDEDLANNLILEIYNMKNSNVLKDVSEINFDTENFIYNPDEVIDECADYIGFKVLSNGLSFLGMFVGGDWESAIYLIIYWDGNKFRGYIPRCGNIFNPLNDSAFGNDEEIDNKFIQSEFGVSKSYYELKNTINNSNSYSWDLIKEDIMSYIIKK